MEQAQISKVRASVHQQCGNRVKIQLDRGRKLNDIVDAAYDIQEETAKRKAAKAAAKAKYEASKGTAKPKRQRESLAKTVDRLTDILDALQDKIQK